MFDESETMIDTRQINENTIRTSELYSVGKRLMDSNEKKKGKFSRQSQQLKS